MRYAEAAKLLLANDNILILTHCNPDGDTLGSAAALCSALRRMGKTAFLYPNSEVTERYLDFVKGYFAPEGFEAGYTVAVDIASESLFPKGFYGSAQLCIDHHPSNTKYARRYLIQDTKASCGEIVMRVISSMTGSITPEEANLLYVAVSTDCGCFQYMNTNADTLRAAAELVDAGAKNGELNIPLFRKISPARMKLEGLIYSDMEFYRDGKIVVVTVTKNMLLRTGANEDDCDDLANIAGRAKGGILSVTIREKDNGECRISLRSTPEVDSSAICAVFGGGGHAMAAGCTVKADPEGAKKMLLEVIDEVWK